MRLTDSQRECVEKTFGIPSAVEAGAGSGKTATLTARIVYALQHPEVSGVSDIEQALIITYTNKAASELKSRIKGALEAAGMSEQALKVDGAWISTIHGMCSRILKENAFTFGVDPCYDILSDEVRGKILDNAIEIELKQAGKGRPDQKAALLDEYGRATVKETLATLIDKASESGLPLRECFVLPYEEDPLACLLDLVNYTVEFRDRCEGSTGKTAQEYYAKAETSLRILVGTGDETVTEQDIARWSATLGDISADEVLALASLLPKPAGNFGKVGKDPLESAGEPPVAALYGRACDLRLAVGRPHLATFIEVASGVAVRFSEMKTQLGVMDNNDLIAKAAKALKDPQNADIRRRYSNQFQLVMVDEFQDTNQVQVDMINLIAGGDAGHISHKLCVVGDAQQSIYRFRNADLEVFRDHVTHVCDVREDGPQGKVIEFQKNFRSHGQILAFAKEVFERAFDADTYLELLHGRDEEYAGGKTPFFGVDSSDTEALADAGESGELAEANVSEAPAGPMGIGGPADVPHRVNVRVYTDTGNKSISQEAAAAIARDFAELARRGHKPGQMAVLLGSMTHAAAYAQALQDVGLRCAITGGSVFKESNEAKLVVKLCYALANMRHTSALASVLASDLFCLSAEDLLELMEVEDTAAGKVKPTLADAFACAMRKELFLPAGCSPKLACAVSVLSAAAQQVGQRDMSRIVEDVLVNSGWLLRLGAEGTVRAGNAFKAIRLLAAIEASEHVDALDLAQRFEARIDELKEAPGVLSAKGDDFVRIMTIHASKGLQFPIVAVSDAEFRFMDTEKLKTLSAGSKVYLSMDANASLEGISSDSVLNVPSAKVGSVVEGCDAKALWRMVEHPRRASESAEAIKALNRMAERAEHRRKLYVAYTRAEDALIVNLKAGNENGEWGDEGPDVADAICELVCGEGESYSCEKGAAVRQLVSVRTRYAGHPEQDLSWTLRLNVTSFAKDPDKASDAKGAASGEGCDSKTYEQDAPENAASGQADAQAGEQAGNADCAEPMFVPTSFPDFRVREEAFRPQWAEGLLSASSIKGKAAEPDSPDGEHDASISLDGSLKVRGVGFDAADALAERLGPEDPGDAGVSFDDDEPVASAADRGTAFHALCEWAARHRGTNGAFEAPPADRIEAISASYGLSGAQKALLPAMLERWLSSTAAKQAQRRVVVKPECPFAVKLDDGRAGRRPLVLQGFIDLLSYDEYGKGTAHVVDYKTGSHLATDAKRRAAYETQARTYAYALLLQGFEDVQLDFVFVDQPQNPITHFPAEGEAPYTVDQLRKSIVEAL